MSTDNLIKRTPNDLPPDLKRLALSRHDSEFSSRYYNPGFSVEEMKIIKMFIWDKTPEGDKFWQRVYEFEKLPKMERKTFKLKINLP